MSKETKTPTINVSKIKKEIKYSLTLLSVVQLDRNTNGIIPVVNKINITEIPSTPSL